MTATSSPTSPARPVDGPPRWAVVATGAGLLALSGPGQTAGFSVFVDPVTEAFDVSRSQLTAAYLVATLLAAPVGMWLGQQIDRRRLVTMIRFVGACLAISLAFTAVSPGLVLLAVGVFGMRAFGQSGMTLTGSVFVARAITERRGAALGLLSAVGGFSITLTPLISSRLIPAIGWRETWMLLAFVVLVVSFALAGVTTRAERARGAAARARDELDPVPVDHVAVDLGVPIEPAEAIVGIDDETGHPDPRRRRWGFIVVTAGVATTGGVGTALAFHQVAVLGERGLSASEAATNFLPQSLAAALVAIVAGRLVDRVPGQLVVPAVMMMLVGGLLSLHLVSSSMTAVVFGVFMGAALGANGATEGALLARWTGTVTLGRLRGRMMAIAVASTAVAPLWFTLLSDAVGSYSRAALITLAAPCAVAAMALLAPVPRGRPTPTL